MKRFFQLALVWKLLDSIVIYMGAKFWIIDADTCLLFSWFLSIMTWFPPSQTPFPEKNKQQQPVCWTILEYQWFIVLLVFKDTCNNLELGIADLVVYASSCCVVILHFAACAGGKHCHVMRVIRNVSMDRKDFWSFDKMLVQMAIVFVINCC